ncbi:ABC-type dipeptide/oligopeptide/nickel transport system, permease component [Rubellimicrobium thermophilum DSM 16684]|uniref:Oligopeptide transport system permease protein OppC n=1 Tax=Rubellimicrobium thermophilum DSM 16684 TaxID=1123069 RepID=S9QYM2_9RHOB|nr:ABC transporter permease subunit [Rubellimicrobium thermophilum]EPX84682.1 ABC-type dipeptide/oligopeptide/nickel transport system, permease component [Rubellimicrobium thermophilum DSM 16684]
MALTTDPLDPLPAAADLPQGRSLWADARRRFFRNRAATVSLVVLGLIAIFAFGGELVAQYERDTIDFTLIGINATKGVPSFATGHYFGTDQEGRDLFARTVQGTRLSLLIGIVGSLVAVVVGTLYGAIAGYVGGRVDSIMMRIVDILLSIPFMFVLILLLVMFGRSLLMLFIGIGLVSWLSMARIARGQTLSIKNKEFVEAAIATGVRPLTIILRHIVPNLAGVVVVYATLLIPEMIIYESFISFLGLGVQEPNTSLGSLISRGAAQIGNGVPWQLGFPLFFFVAMLFAFYFVGDGLRDALDPKDR